METDSWPTLDCMSIERLTATRANAEPAADLSFAIAVTESAARPRHTMKHGDSFLVLDSHGDIGVSAGGPDGLFHHDTRYLSQFGLLVNGLQPLLLGSNLSNDNCVLTVDLTNPDIVDRDTIILSKSLLHVSRTVFVARDTLYQRFVVHNYAAETVPLLLSFTFGSDFADVFEVRGLTRARRGVAHARDGRRLGPADLCQAWTASRVASTCASIPHRPRSPFRPLRTELILHRRARPRSTPRHAAIRKARKPLRSCG